MVQPSVGGIIVVPLLPPSAGGIIVVPPLPPSLSTVVGPSEAEQLIAQISVATATNHCVRTIASPPSCINRKNQRAFPLYQYGPDTASICFAAYIPNVPLKRPPLPDVPPDHPFARGPSHSPDLREICTSTRRCRRKARP